MTRNRTGLTLSLMALSLGSLGPARADGVLEQMQNDVAAVVRTAKGSVVSIEDEGGAPGHRFGAEQRPGEQVKNPEHGRRGGSSPESVNIPKSGSGFSIGNGYIVTTADVVDGMQRPIVITDDGTHIRAKLVGIDSEMNLGLLLISVKANLPALRMGDSDTAVPGHFAIAIGNQAGHNNSVALTMIAGLRTEGTFTGERFYPSLIQIAGTVGAGTSGAPILNARGEVIGVIAGVPAGEWMETQFFANPQSGLPSPEMRGRPFPPGLNGLRNPQNQIFNPPLGQNPNNPFPLQPGTLPSGTEQNGPSGSRLFLRPPVTSAGFAIPINDLQFSIKELMTNGKIVHIWLGVDLKNERQVSEDDGIIKVLRFVRVRGIFPDSPAQKAGIQPGDILSELNGKPLKSGFGMRMAIMRIHPADKVPVTIVRNGATMAVVLTVEARPAKVAPPAIQPK